MTVVAFFHPHNEGTVAGIITGPGFDTGTNLTDTYEVDASIASFETEDQARAWLGEQIDGEDWRIDLEEVPGGFLSVMSDDD